MTRPTGRILYLVNAFEADAPTRLMLAGAGHMRLAGEWEVCFAALSRGGALASEVANLAGRWEVAGMRSPFSLRGWSSLARIVREFRPDILHASLLRPTLLGVPAARWCGVPRVVITNHGVHEWQEGGSLLGAAVPPAFRRVARLADVLVAVSDPHLRELKTAGVTAGALRVIPNGVDVGKFRPDLRSGRSAILAGLGFGGGREPILVGAAGNLRPVKGYDILLEAAAVALRRVPHLRFAIWGEGPERQRLEATVSRLGLSGRVVLPGRIADPAPSLAACDLFVQPSRRESFGLAAAEAMACGVPVVASAAGGLTELVEDGVSGLLAAPGSAESLASGIAYLADSAALRDRLGAAARERIVNRFTLETMVRSYRVVYENLMRGRCEP